MTNWQQGQPELIKGEKPLESLQDWLARQSYRELFILTDTAVAEDVFPVIEPYVMNMNLKGVLTIPPGEAHKTTECCEDVWGQLLANDASRHSLLLNLGGGVVTDLGGFAASTFKRGIRFVHVPTTLLGMVDAAIGGKNGVNLHHYKNQIGVFQHPEQIVIAPDFLKTLEERQILSGMAEMLKHALIADQEQWQALQQINSLTLNQLEAFIVPAAQLKMGIVKSDPFEKGQRKKLNFGHTIGHALESLSQEKDADPLLHGEAIALGMRVEAFLSEEHLLLDAQARHSIDAFLAETYPSYPLNQEGVDKVINYMKADKKRDREAFNFTLLPEIGQADTDVQLSKDDVVKGLSKVLQA